jgi:hypothetical protein
MRMELKAIVNIGRIVENAEVEEINPDTRTPV